MEESEQAWLKMEESKSQDEILISLSDLMYSDMEKATQEFKLLLTLLPVEMVKRSLKGAQGRLSIQNKSQVMDRFCTVEGVGSWPHEA